MLIVFFKYPKNYYRIDCIPVNYFHLIKEICIDLLKLYLNFGKNVNVFLALCKYIMSSNTHLNYHQ